MSRAGRLRRCKLSVSTIAKIKSFAWQRWLERPFGPFMLSLFIDGVKKESFKKIGVPGVECKAILCQQGVWYESEKVWREMGRGLVAHLKKHSIFEITSALTDFYRKKKKRMQALVKGASDDPKKQLAEIYEILTVVATFIWLAHGLEEVYKKRLNKIVPKFIKGDIDKFIGDASFPKKKNAYFLMEEAMRRGDDPKKITDRFGWLRSRDGFSEPFSVADVKKQIKELEPPKPRPKVKIPGELKQLFKEARELVFFRTARTDVFYELLFLSRPILRRIEKFYNIPFAELKYYPIQSLIAGKPRRYSASVSFACYRGIAIFSEKPLVKEVKEGAADLIKGMIAYKGVARGVAKIVKLVSELGKVKKGDILVTQMTFPSFIIAMRKAAAFVTDEGGITCHAAIVAREMQKPCIIGTKTATKVLRNGDMVEVDANKGVVRKI